MMTQEEVSAMRPAGARLRLVWQTRGGEFGLVERRWSDGQMSYGIIRRDGLWLQVDRDFLVALHATVAEPEETPDGRGGTDG